MAWASAAQAQVEAAPQLAPADESSAQATAEDIIVTGSRVIRNGDAAPTPLTVVSADQLNLAAPTTIADALSQIPQFRGSTRAASFVSPQSPVASYVNLRGLSDQATPRTLVLFDGRRVAPSTYSGQVDIATLPNLLINRVDIVTGGASAAYGTDAIAGVVNYVLDRNFTGLKADVNAGISSRGDNGQQKIAVAGGAKLLDGRLHLLGSVEYFHTSGITSEDGREWAQRQCQAINNPGYPNDGRPSFLLRCGVVGTDLAPGGVINTGPLQGTQFLAGGVPAPYQFGTERTAATMIGGDGAWLSRGNITSPFKTLSAFAHADFDVNDSIRLFAEGNYNKNEATLAFVYPFFTGGTGFTIFNDNPYIPAATRAAMAGAGQRIAVSGVTAMPDAEGLAPNKAISSGVGSASVAFVSMPISFLIDCSIFARAGIWGDRMLISG